LRRAAAARRLTAGTRTCVSLLESGGIVGGDALGRRTTERDEGGAAELDELRVSHVTHEKLGPMISEKPEPALSLDRSFIVTQAAAPPVTIAFTESSRVESRCHGIAMA
jgi:hypothetical protein